MTDLPIGIKDRITMHDVCRFYGVEVNRNGFARCPFHNEKTASMKVYPNKGGFYCFGCGASGDVITFVQKYFDIDFPTAIKRINEDFALGLPIGKKLTYRDKEKLRQQDRQRKKEERLQQLERERIENAYWKAFSNWQRYDSTIRLYKPECPEEVPKADFIEALKNIEQAKYELEQAELARYKYEHGD